jgi:hypothetical protein
VIWGISSSSRNVNFMFSAAPSAHGHLYIQSRWVHMPSAA